MNRSDWVWMPHAAHFICGHDCRFHLATYVGVLVSTIGEYWPDREVRRIHAEARGITIDGKGDAWDAAYFARFGYDTIGLDRRYETMVFPAERVDGVPKCCPWVMADGQDLDFVGYNDAAAAYIGHLEMCERWANKQVPVEAST